MGAKKKPFYRVVVTERTHARDGRCVEIIGHYNPVANPPAIDLNLERVRHWIAQGARPSETVTSLIKKVTPTSSVS